MGEMHFGVNRILEGEADRLIAESLRGGRAHYHADKSDVLTPWKSQERRRREVYTATGMPDPAIRLGVFGRALNTRQVHLNSRDGLVAPQKDNRSQISLADFVASQGVESFKPYEHRD